MEAFLYKERWNKRDVSLLAQKMKEIISIQVFKNKLTNLYWDSNSESRPVYEFWIIVISRYKENVHFFAISYLWPPLGALETHLEQRKLR